LQSESVVHANLHACVAGSHFLPLAQSPSAAHSTQTFLTVSHFGVAPAQAAQPGGNTLASAPSCVSTGTAAVAHAQTAIDPRVSVTAAARQKLIA
jgi:hypothetical protein